MAARAGAVPRVELPCWLGAPCALKKSITKTPYYYITVSQNTHHFGLCMLHMPSVLINHGRTKHVYWYTSSPPGSLVGRARPSRATRQDAAPSITSNLLRRPGAVAARASGLRVGGERRQSCYPQRDATCNNAKGGNERRASERRKTQHPARRNG